jgi:hypothetical protein
MKIAFKYSIGPNSFFNRSPVSVDGREVGEVLSHTQGSGWSGRATSYTFHPSDEFAEMGIHAEDSQRALKAWIANRMLAVAVAKGEQSPAPGQLTETSQLL